MTRRIKATLCTSLLSFGLAAGILQAADPQVSYPPTPRIAVSDTLHGVVLTDNYRWLEEGQDSAVIRWTEEQERLTHDLLDTLSQREWLAKRFNELWRYDDEGVPQKVLQGERVFVWTKKKDDEKWVFNTREYEQATLEVLLDPNTWEAEETLDGAVPSRDGKYVAFGRGHGGDENPIYHVMETATHRILPDTLKGWRQGISAWMPDNSGFYYSANPLKGEVPEGEEYYWQAAYFHKLGTPAEDDRKVFWDDSVKEYWHSVGISEDGQFELYYRSLFNKNEVYFRQTGSNQDLIPIATGFEAQYSVEFIEDKMLITTDLEAPMYKVYIADIAKPQREYWREFIPESQDRLSYITGISGHLYAVYEHNAYTVVKIYSLAGQHERDLRFPTIGEGSVSGYWSRPEVWVYFSSFTYPSTTFKYEFEADSLILYKKYPVEVDVANFTAEQVWYTSRDSTRVPMFLVYRKDLVKDGRVPTVLTGYGGFNISITPYFSTSKVVWLEAGGMVAIPNLRGGGEFGRKWHEAGMLDKKQNVFDDFIAAAEWLIQNGYTCPEKLAISGGSNGGLLVGAAAVQRPDLFQAVDCAVPLLDMINYHRFGLANIWAEEYGSSENPEQFKYLYKYSPYQNIVAGTDYPAMLITGSENDARVDPLHARKMVARLQEADPNGRPILLLVHKASGHGGGTTLSVQIAQRAEEWAFLMHELGMVAPK